MLGRIPFVGTDLANSLEPTVAERAYDHMQGFKISWIHRTLESISKEIVLQRLLFRLMQAQLPIYAQVRHGPIEYGKDIVALVEGDNGAVLKMYQVKAGHITKANWPKARDEVEEMFQVPLPSIQLPVEPSRLEGVLIFNGHLNPHVEPVVAGWKEEQARDHKRSIEIMHIDSIVKWIINGALINELRCALAELGIAIVDHHPETTHSDRS
jgi:hypothetical protein